MDVRLAKWRAEFLGAASKWVSAPCCAIFRLREVEEFPSEFNR